MLVLLWTALFASGCQTVPDPIYVYKTVEVVRDRYVAVPERMTGPVEIAQLPAEFMELSEEDALKALGAAYKHRGVRLLQCNGRLQEISRLVD